MTHANAVSPRKVLSQEYLTVIYGLVTTDGLREFIVSFRRPDHLLFWTGLLLFGGTFLQALHFWMTSVTADKTAAKMYDQLAVRSPRQRILRLLADMLFATTIAGCILTMFLNLDASGRIFFRFFLILAVVSFGYDLFTLVMSSLTEALGDGATSGERSTQSDYRRLVTTWLLQDVYCVAGCSCTYYLVYPHFWSRNPLLVGCVYLFLVTAFFALDVLLFHWETYSEGLLR